MTKLSYETPLLKSLSYSQKHSKQVFLKLENTQPSGSFKSRGLGNLVQHHHDLASNTTGETQKKVHFFSSSGGNAGLATAVAAITKGHLCTVVVPSSTKLPMRQLIEETGANVVVYGEFWGQADEYLRTVLLPQAEADGNTKAVYCHPYDNPLLWDGYTSIIKEIADTVSKSGMKKPDAILCAVGGGGLYTGLIQGLLSEKESILEGVSVITAETEGASKLAQSLKAGSKVTLSAPRTVATSLAAFSVSDQAYNYASTPSTTATFGLTVTDQDAVTSCISFAKNHRFIVEPACGAALAALAQLTPGAVDYAGKLLPDSVTREDAVIVVIVCGGSSFTLDNLLELSSK